MRVPIQPPRITRSGVCESCWSRTRLVIFSGTGAMDACDAAATRSMPAIPAVRNRNPFLELDRLAINIGKPGPGAYSIRLKLRFARNEVFLVLRYFRLQIRNDVGVF